MPCEVLILQSQGGSGGEWMVEPGDSLHCWGIFPGTATAGGIIIVSHTARRMVVGDTCVTDLAYITTLLFLHNITSNKL